ncbi:MAG: hypothetical protein MUC87_03190 [Bacteroidia bacterium]|jgi:hypothetical protein|nr:hypothetical protein [Bacteroidia bacterium]
MLKRTTALLLLLLLSSGVYAQDSSFVTRKLLYGLSGSWFTTHSARKAPDVSGNMLLPIIGSTRTLYSNLLQAYPVTFHAAFPFQKHWEIGFRFGWGISRAERIRATATALALNSNGDIYVSDFSVERIPYNSNMWLFQVSLLREIIEKDRFMLGIGPGFLLTKNAFDLRAVPQVCVQIPLQYRIGQSTWIEFTPTISRHLSGVHVGIEKSLEVKRRAKPNHWYIRTYDEDE